MHYAHVFIVSNYACSDNINDCVNILSVTLCIPVADPGFLKGGGQSTPLGGSGGMLPQKIFNFRPSEVVSGAFWVENCFLRLL